MVKKCLSRMSGKLSCTVLRRGKGSNPFPLVDFTNPDYIALLDEAGVKISMDGKGQALDNVRTERFFRTIKYDLIYINEFDSPKELRRAIDAYMVEYNTYRPHSSIGGFCPEEAYNTSLFDAA